MRGGFMRREQQQEDHRHHFLALDLSALLFDPHKFSDETVTTILPRCFDLFLQIALHCEDIRDPAEEADDAPDARDAAGPGGELGPVGKRQAEQFADHRKRQLSRVAVDEVGRAALCEQFRGELLGDREDVRLHVEDGATAKGFVYNAPQTSVIRLVHRQHMVDERAQDARHPPWESGDAAIVPADGESLGVLQHSVGQILCRRGPNFPDDREPHLDHLPCRSEPLNLSNGIAKIALAGKIHAQVWSLQVSRDSRFSLSGPYAGETITEIADVRVTAQDGLYEERRFGLMTPWPQVVSTGVLWTKV